MMASNSKKRSKGSKASESKKKRKINGSDDDVPAYLSSKYAEPPTSKIYNDRLNDNCPNELFRKDLISAMKLPDSENLKSADYWEIEDSWKSNWERGVQVPVHPDAMPEPSFRELRKKSKGASFKLPKKYICSNRSSSFNPNIHYMSYTDTIAEGTCRYDVDVLDTNWLMIVNQDREEHGIQPLEAAFLEQVIEEFEEQAYVNLHEAVKSEEGLGSEYDEDAICDACRSPDSHEGNEMVFCDACNICVHQNCYGISKIPEGSWICGTCALRIEPSCELCPNRGGAMKTISCGQKWVHVACALWIPEVCFLNSLKMEPIIKISHVPPHKWNLPCCFCDDKKGVCITCSEKGCKVTFHVTCAFKEGLQMNASVKNCNSSYDLAADVTAFCKKHSRKESHLPGSEESGSSPSKSSELSSEERAKIRQRNIKEREAQFYVFVNIEDVIERFQADRGDIEMLFNYWQLKRMSNNNEPLLPPKVRSENRSSDDSSSVVSAIARRLIHRRHELERARNLCYMIIKRERLAKKWTVNKEKTFIKQKYIMSKLRHTLSNTEREAVLSANSGDIALDKSLARDRSGGEPWQRPDTLKLFAALGGKKMRNGLLKTATPVKKLAKGERSDNPYAKHYLNGLEKRTERWYPVDSDLKKKPTAISKKRLSSQSTTSERTNSDEGAASTIEPTSQVPTSPPDHPDQSEGTCLSLPCSTDFPDDTLQEASRSDICSVSLKEVYDIDAYPLLEISPVTDELGQPVDVFVTPIEVEVVTEECAAEAEPQLKSEDLYDNVKQEAASTSENSFCNGFKLKNALLSSHGKIDVQEKKVKNKRKKKLLSLKSRRSNNKISDLLEPKSDQDQSDPCEVGISIKKLKSVAGNADGDHQMNENDMCSSTPICIKQENDSSELPSEEKKCARLELQQLSTSDCKSEDDEESHSTTLIDFKSILGKASLKVALERNLGLQMEQNHVKLPEAVVVLKPEDIVACFNSEGALKNDSVIAEPTSDVVLEEQTVALRNDTPPSNSESCDTPSSHSVVDESKSKARSHHVQNKNCAKQPPTNSSDKTVDKIKHLNNSALNSSSPVNKPSSSTSDKCQEKNDASDSSVSDSKPPLPDSKEKPPVVLPKKDMLRGYKIPKKSSLRPVVNSLDQKRGSSPLSPLPDFTPSVLSGYQNNNAKSSWRKLESRAEKPVTTVPPPPPPPPPLVNGDSYHQSERLVLKLKKDRSDPESQRWHADPNTFNRNRGWDFVPNHGIPPLLPPPMLPFMHHPVPCMNSSQWRPMRSREQHMPPRMNFHPRPYKT